MSKVHEIADDQDDIVVRFDGKLIDRAALPACWISARFPTGMPAHWPTRSIMPSGIGSSTSTAGDLGVTAVVVDTNIRPEDIRRFYRGKFPDRPVPALPDDS